MKIHRDNNNNSTCLKELADFEGGGGAMECLVHGGGGDIPGRYLWPTDGRRWGLRMEEARDDGPAGPRVGD